MSISLVLDWSRCQDGVEIQEFGVDGTRSLADHSGSWFRARSSRRVPIRFESSDLENPLVLRLVNARSVDDVAALLGRFGMRSEKDQEPVEDVLRWRDYLMTSSVLALSGDINERAETINKLLDKVLLKPTFDFSGEQQSARLTYQPQDLNQFMCMEVALASIHGASVTRCANCSKMFFTGPLTGRRAHAVYCSDRCRVAAMRKRNAEV